MNPHNWKSTGVYTGRDNYNVPKAFTDRVRGLFFSETKHYTCSECGTRSWIHKDGTGKYDISANWDGDCDEIVISKIMVA